MKRLLVVVLLGVSILCSAAQPPQYRHSFSIGWGDMLFETLAFHPKPEENPFGYTGHFFAEYQYAFTRVVSAGMQLDYEGIFTGEMKNHNFVTMPTLYFSFLRKDWFRMYAGLGAGLLWASDDAGGSEFAPVFNINFLGAEFGKGHWTGAVELGSLISLKNANKIYMFGSRLISARLNYRF